MANSQIIITTAKRTMRDQNPDELVAAMQACRRHFLTAAAFSFALNVLHLTAPLYMMQVYDRVISSGSGTTLAMLTLITLVAFGALAGLDQARTSVLSAASLRLDRMLAGRVFDTMMREALSTGNRHQQALRDLDVCRHFISGRGMMALFDVPWIPLYVLMTFTLHWLLGMFTLLCAAVLVGLAIASEWRVRGLSLDAQARSTTAYGWADSCLRNAHSVQAMSMMPGLLRYWSRARGQAVAQNHWAGMRSATMSSIVKFLRMSMQSLVLGLGAWLVIERATSPGAIFAASLLLGRALQPVEQIIGQWQSLLSARSTFARLRALLEAHPAPAVITSAFSARPAGRLIANDAGLSLPGLPAPLLQGATFHIQPGESVGLIGPSGAGKSTLVRLMVGAVEPSEGSVQLAGVDVPRLFELAGGSPIGYMPQEVELFGETIAANISRFGRASREEIERAAQIAGAHDMIMSLPKGYLTHLGEGGSVLSGGMRQRIALARAVFGNPSLVVLDEPSSNLDNVGDVALATCIRYLQTQGTTVVMVSHRPVTTALMQKFIVVIDGRVQAFGSREEVVQRLSGGRLSTRRGNAVMESGVETAHRMSA